MRLLAEGTADRAVVVSGISAAPRPALTYARGVTLYAGSDGDLDDVEAGAVAPGPHCKR